MSVKSRSYDLQDEAQRLDERLDELAEQIVNADSDTSTGQRLKRDAYSVETQLSGVHYLIENFGEDAEVEISGLNAGEYAKVQDRTAEIRQHQGGQASAARSNVFAAVALKDAPFLPDDATDLDDYLKAVANEPIGVSEWIEDRANDLTAVAEGNFKPLAERLRDQSTG